MASDAGSPRLRWIVAMQIGGVDLACVVCASFDISETIDLGYEQCIVARKEGMGYLLPVVRCYCTHCGYVMTFLQEDTDADAQEG